MSDELRDGSKCRQVNERLFRGLWKNQTAGISNHRNVIEIILLVVLSPKRSAILSPILFTVVIKSTTNTCRNKNQTGIT